MAVIRSRKTSEDVEFDLKICKNLATAKRILNGHFLKEEVKELRHWVLYTQVEIELDIELIIIAKLGDFEEKTDEKGYDKRIIFTIQMRKVMEGMTFDRKLKIAKSIGAVKDEYQILDRLRILRNTFAHGHDFELKEYENHEKMLDAYRITLKALDTVENLTKKYYPLVNPTSNQTTSIPRVDEV